MKSGLIFLIAALAVVVTVVVFLSYRGSSASVLQKSAEPVAASDSRPVALSGESATAPARQVQTAPVKEPPAHDRSAPLSQAPAAQTKPPITDEEAATSGGGTDLTSPMPIRVATSPAKDLETKYANLSTADFRAVFADLTNILQQQRAGGGKEQARPMTEDQLGDLEREIAFVKERAYP